MKSFAKDELVPNRLVGKAAIVTGAARGIGRAVSERLAREGARVAMVDWNEAELEDAVGEIRKRLEPLGGEADAVESHAADVSQRDQVAQVVSEAHGRWGRLDVLVNNAAVAKAVPFLELDLEEWNRVITVNLTSMFHCSQEAAPLIASSGGGSIINLSSITAEAGSPRMVHYATTKGAIRSFTRSLAIALSEQHIRVNSISPGTIRTPANSRELDDPDLQPSIVARIPVGRIGQPEDVAALVAYLAADESEYITGIDVLIDGGQRALGRKIT